MRRSKPDSCSAAKSPLLDHLVGEREQLWWNFKSKRLRGLEIDHQLVLGRCLHWKLGWLLALENANFSY